MANWHQRFSGKGLLIVLIGFSLITAILIQQDKAHWFYQIVRHLLRALFR